MTNHGSILPPEAKWPLLVDYAHKIGAKVLIETGTHRGYTVEHALPFFRDIYSIELGEHLYEYCVQMFAGQDNVHLFQGDSAVLLPIVLEHVNESAIFWLDAHYSGGDTVLGPKGSAIGGEIDAILKWGRGDAAILIDDIRDFGGGDYPPIEEIGKKLLLAHPDWVFYVENDIARAHRS
jgi:hypothetical protein